MSLHPPVVSPVCFVIRASRRLPMPPTFFIGLCKTCSKNGATGYLTGAELAAAVLSGNLSRRLSCARCGDLGPAQEAAAIETWLQPDDGAEAEAVLTTVPPDKIPPHDADKSVSEQLVEVQKGSRQIAQVGAMPSAMACLQCEFKDTSMGKFLVSLKPHVRARDAIRLGLTAEMAFCQPDSWDIIFSDAYYTPTDLVNLGGTFTRMLIAGLPEGKLLGSAIDAPGLSILKFNKHALDCAMWSEETWNKYNEEAGGVDFFQKTGSKTCSFCSYTPPAIKN